MARAPATARRWKLPSFENTSFMLVFLGLPLALYVVFVISPFVQAFYYSMTDWSGFSKTMNSYHLTGHAVDVVPILDVNKDGKINAVDMYDWGALRKLAPHIKKAAKSLGVPIEWGGDWQSFPDGPHWQIPRSYK